MTAVSIKNTVSGCDVMESWQNILYPDDGCCRFVRNAGTGQSN